MSQYMNAIGAISPSARGAKRVADIVAALAPPPRFGAEVAKQPEPPKESTGKIVVGLAPGVGVGALGAMLWGDHRVLGFLAGHAVGSTGYSIWKGSPAERKSALCQLGVEGAGVAGALMWDRHPLLGWILGVVGGSAATSFVQGSPAQAWKQKLLSK